MAVAITLSLFFSIAAVVLFFLIRREIRAFEADVLSKLRDMLLEMLRKGHGYPDPSGAAVAQGEPASGKREATSGQLPAPVHARVAVGLRLDGPRRQPVSVTRDSDPIHTRSTVAEAPPAPAPAQVPPPGFADRVMARIEAEARPVRPPRPSSNMTLPERVERRHGELTRAAGGVAVHCKGAKCKDAVFAGCACACAPCALVRALLSRAQRDVGMVEIERTPGERREAWEARAAEAKGAHDGTGDRSTVFMDDRATPEGEPESEAPRAAPLDVAQALGVPPGMVGLSIDESDAAQDLRDVPIRRSTLTTHPSEPPPAGVQSVPHPPTDDDRARWGSTRQRVVRLDEVRARGTTPVPPGPANDGAARPVVYSRTTTAIDVRYDELCDAASAAGLPVDHCNNHGTDCHDDDPGDLDASACLCPCDGCARARSYVEQAERDVLGPSQADDAARSGRTK